MKLNEAIILSQDSNSMILENVMTRAISRIVPNAIRSTVLTVYENRQGEVAVHARRGSDNSISLFSSNGRETDSIERLSGNEAQERIAGYEEAGFRPVRRARDFTHIMNSLRISVAGGIVGSALYAVTYIGREIRNAREFVAQRAADTLSRGVNRPSRPAPAEVEMGPDPDFSQIYRDDPSLDLSPRDADMQPVIPSDVAERLKGEAIDRVIGPNGELHIDSYHRHFARLVMDYLKDMRVHPSELPSLDMFQ